MAKPALGMSSQEIAFKFGTLSKSFGVNEFVCVEVDMDLGMKMLWIVRGSTLARRYLN